MGTLMFTPSFSRRRVSKYSCGTRIRISLRLVHPASAQHGLHVHMFGDIRSVLGDGKSTGGHYGSEDQAHAFPYRENRHWGDFGNVKPNQWGRVKLDRIERFVKTELLVGRGVTLHRDRDRGEMFQPSGAAGPRIAVGTIGYMNDEWVDVTKA